jgi:hypothetical protein
VAFPKHVYTAQEQFSSPIFVAEVLKQTSLLEDDLDFTLSLYFCAPGRHFSFIEIVTSQLQFSTKLRILETISVRKYLKSRMQAVTGLRRFQRIRNMVAHPILLRPSKIQTMCEDADIRRMILGFPDTLTDEFRKVRRSMYHLTRSREWKPDPSAKMPDKLDQAYHFLHRIAYA